VAGERRRLEKRTATANSRIRIMKEEQKRIERKRLKRIDFVGFNMILDDALGILTDAIDYRTMRRSRPKEHDRP